MRRFFGIVLLLAISFYMASAQETAQKPDSLFTKRTDTLKPAPYINEGKIAARRAAIQSAMLPGLGQLSNKVTFWSVGKVALIYGGAAALTVSYIDNTKYYNIFLDELKYRQTHNDEPSPNSIYANYPTQGLYTAKDVYRRNREIIIFSYVGIYLVNIIDAYVASRLKYFNVSEDLSIRISPDLINSNTVYASSMAPALKLSIKL